MALGGINLGDVYFFSRYRDFVAPVPGKSGTRLLMQCYGFAKSPHRRECNSLIAARAGDMEINAFPLACVCFNCAVEETQSLVVLTQLVIDERCIDINLPGPQQLPMTYKDFAGGSCVAQRLGRAIQAQAGADTPNTSSRPAHLIADCEKFLSGSIQKWQRIVVSIHTSQRITTGH